MAVDFQKARDFVYNNGTLWERALFAYLFQAGMLERLHQCLRCYRNPDGGWGHALEHDIRTPDSHPLALEYILGVLVRVLDIPTGDLFDEASAWVTTNQNTDGSLRNPASVLDYPHAPWWNEGGQTTPDSIVGNLAKIGKASPELLDATQQWVAKKLRADDIKDTDWLFMMYHAYDYYMNVDDTCRQLTVDHIVELAEAAPPEQYYSLFQFAPTPDSAVAQALPAATLSRYLDHLETSQQEDGGWRDQHGLPQWYPYVTILVLRALQQYGRLTL